MLCNPASGRVRRRLQDVRALGTSLAGERYLELDGAALGTQALRNFLDRPADLLVVAGGDGTLHAVLGVLLDPARGATRPLVLAVPAGTTNMSALDIGVTGGPLAVLARLRTRLQQQHDGILPAVNRPVLGVRRAGAAPLCGMFLGAGIIARGVEYFTQRVRGTGFTGEAAAGVVVARCLGALLGADRTGLTAPVHATVQGVASLPGRRPFVALLATVLDRLLLGMRPHWGREAAPIHFTAVEAQPAQLWRRLVPLLRGRGDHLHTADGYTSTNTDGFAMALEGSFVLDGQCYDTAGAPLQIGIAGHIAFLRP